MSASPAIATTEQIAEALARYEADTHAKVVAKQNLERAMQAFCEAEGRYSNSRVAYLMLLATQDAE